MLVLALAACGRSTSNGAQACEPAEYTACGCGCCGGTAPVEQCVDVAGGQTMQQIIDADRQAAQSAGCASAGCSLPLHYTCCPGH